MRICNLADGLGQLNRAVAELNQKWTETKQHWSDETSRQFEEDYLGPLPGQMQLLVASVQALAATVDKAARELGDPEHEA
jgi:hypothetical protein